ncbi:MAG: hypothetical protein ABH863_04015 [Candidatus Micrarchaeota archaeon]
MGIGGFRRAEPTILGRAVETVAPKVYIAGHARILKAEESVLQKLVEHRGTLIIDPNNRTTEQKEIVANVNKHMRDQISAAHRKLSPWIKEPIGVTGMSAVLLSATTPDLHPLATGLGLGIGGLATLVGLFPLKIRSRFRSKFQKAQRFETPIDRTSAIDALISSLKLSIANRRRLVDSAV